MKNRLLGRTKYPLVLMLEPLYRCNLECKGCGKIQHPVSILRQHLSVEQCVEAATECPAPVVTVCGGEPLVHPQIEDITTQLTQKLDRIVYLCTNAVVLPKKIDKFKPHKNLIFSLHLDGLKETHDHAVCKDGVFDIVMDMIKELKQRGFLVATNTTIFSTHKPEEIRTMFNMLTDMGVDMLMISPGYAYEKAPDQEHFLARERTRQFFRALLDKPDKKWPINLSRFYVEFLLGKRDYPCSPWSMPCRSVLGWQRPCYLFTTDLEEAYAKTYTELMTTTDWDLYGTGKHEKCANCMTHCGYEGSAVRDTMSNPWKMMWGGLPGLPKPSKRHLAKDKAAREAAAAKAAASNAHASRATTVSAQHEVHACGSGTPLSHT